VKDLIMELQEQVERNKGNVESKQFRDVEKISSGGAALGFMPRKL